MINKDSIVTAYDEHLTLVEWLQKVSKALKGAVLTGVTINKKSNATLSFVFTFEDGTTLETDDLILQQGESVASAYISNGKLHLVLTNGDDLDAGNMFNGNVVINGAVSTSILTSANDHIEAQKPVVEVMSGYSFTKNVNPSSLSVDFKYAGAVKNGNKLTLSLFVEISPSADVGTNTPCYIGYFITPIAVGNKLIPYTQGALPNVLDHKQVPLAVSDTTITSGVMRAFALKTGPSSVLVLFYPSITMTAGKSYFCRYEVTFLLSDNLAE